MSQLENSAVYPVGKLVRENEEEDDDENERSERRSKRRQKKIFILYKYEVKIEERKIEREKE